MKGPKWKCSHPRVPENIYTARFNNVERERCLTCRTVAAARGRAKARQRAQTQRRGLRAATEIVAMVQSFFAPISRQVGDHARCTPDRPQSLCTECSQLWHEALIANPQQMELAV